MTALPVTSRHHAARTQPVQRVILHAMGEFVQYEGRPVYCTDLLHALGVSAHAIITPDGRVLACVPSHRVAYHARNHNADSVGVEFAVPGVHDYASFIDAIRTPDWPTAAQLEAGVAWVADQCQMAALTAANVTTHALVDPGRKEDPGPGFPLADFLTRVAVALG